MSKNWEEKTLGEVCQNTSNIKWNDSLSNEYKYIDLSSVSRNNLNITDSVDITKETAPSRAKKIIQINDIIFATTRPTLKRLTIIPKEYDNQICSTGYVVLRPKQEIIESKYIYYFLRTDDFINLMESLQKGASYPAVSDKDVKNVLIKFPSLISTQKQIVEILDTAFEALEKAKTNIETNLKNTKELFDSKLNEIFSQKGEGWEEDKIVNVCSILTCGVASTPKYVEKEVGVAFLSAQNVKNGEIILDKYRYISKELHNHLTKKNKPKKGDILYSRVGAKFGEAGVVEHDFEFSVYVSVTLIRPLSEKLNNYYLKYYLNSPIIKSLAKSSITSSGVPNLNVNAVREFPVYYPSVTKQLEIVDKIKELESVSLNIINKYQQKLDNLEELKKSLLQKAFSGELTK